MVLTIAGGYDTGYLLGEVAAGLAAVDADGVRSASAYYTGETAGEPPGRWLDSRGAAVLGLNGVVDAELMQAVFDHGLDPRDPAARTMATWGDSNTLRARTRQSEAQALSAAYRELLGENPGAGASPEGREALRARAVQRVADRRCTQSAAVKAAYRALLDAHPGASPERAAQLRVEADQRVTRSGSVKFFDIQFAPSKSASVLRAACAAVASEHRAAAAAARRAGDDARAGREAAQERVWTGRVELIEAAALEAHAAGIRYLEDNHCYVRTGHHGTDKRTGASTGKWLDGGGFTTAQFLQHDSRAGDPQLHVHGPTLNAVQAPDGSFLTIDGRQVYAGKRAAAAISERTFEALVSTGLGVQFETRPDGVAREIVGIDPASIELFSQRHRALTPVAERLVAEFCEREGRQPTGPERAALRQRACLATRTGKRKAGSAEEQLDGWAQRHRAEVGRTLHQVAVDVFAAAAPVAADRAATWSEQDVIDQALAAVSENCSSWTRAELIGCLSDALPGDLGLSPDRVRPLLERLADTALANAVRLSPEEDTSDLPAALRRADGSSIYSNPAPVRYSAPGQLGYDLAMREAAIERGAATVDPARVEALLANYAAAGRPLSADQEAALRGICASGAMLEVLSAPAGTGKSFLDGVLVQAWEGTGQVRGITFGQRQAEVLTEEGVTSRNIAAWLAGQKRLAQGRAVGDDAAFRLASGDLLIVDEAQMASTDQLVRVVELAHGAGAKVLFTGDPRQGGLGQAGTLADLVGRARTSELFEVRRFAEAWERDASLRLRDGDVSVLADYDRRGRIIDGGAREQTEQLAARAWLADTLQGREALLVTGTNAEADRICGQLRAELVRLGRVEEQGVALGMQGTTAGVGDLIQARHADSRRGLVNRTVYRVQAVNSDGSLVAAQVRYDREDGERLDPPRVIPADYVAKHVSLAYASTKDAAIGRTVDCGHCLWTGGTDAAGGYVALTRGRAGNWAYVSTQETREDSATGETARTVRRNPVAVMEDSLTRPPDPTRLTALAQREQLQQTARELPALLHPLTETLAGLAEARTGQLLDRLTAHGVLTEDDRLAFATDPATGSLTALLRRAELAGHNPEELLTAAIDARDLAGSQSVAQVVYARITKSLGERIEYPTITAFRDLIPAEVPAEYQPVLQRWADAADARRAELGAGLAALPEAQRPAWLASLGPIPEHPLGRADWEQRAGWAASWREMQAVVEPLADADPVGAAPGAGLVDRRAVWRTAHDALELGDGGRAEGEMTDGQLRARSRAYEREQAWAPRYVADELAATHEALRRAQEDATIWRARAAAESDPDARDQLLAAAQEADATAEQAQERIPELEQIDHARAAWFAHTAATREAATRADAELAVRGIDRAAEPQVTAAEWLAAHEAEQADREVTAEVGERDVDDRPHDAEQALADGRGTEAAPDAAHTTAVPDIRDAARPDPTEQPDGQRSRRMPRADETAAALIRAQDATRALAERSGWEAAQEQSDAQDGWEAPAPAPAQERREADERRAEQLHGWDHHDQQYEQKDEPLAERVDEYADADG